MNKQKMYAKTAVIMMSLVIFAVIGTGLANAQIAPPTVSKTATPTDINIAGSGVNEETTITLKVTGAGSTTTTPVPMDVVFALDSSGSMSWNDPTGLRKAAAKSFVDKMDSTRDQAGVVSWDDNIDFTQALSYNFPLVKSKIDAVDSSGGTNLNVGLNGAIGVLDANTRTESSAEVIIFLSNGEGTYTYAADGGPASTAASKGYVIYSIGLGSSPATAALTDMATATGGKYYSSPDPSNLDAIFNDIYKEITTSTIPHYVDVVEVTQSYIIDEGSFNIAPDSVSTVGGITTITWNNIGMGDGNPDLSADETVTLSFKAKSNKAGANLDVDVFGTAKVDYDDKDENYAGSVDIPQAKINVNVNTPPVADAGPDQTVEQTKYQGADVTFDGSGSTDDGQLQPLTYTWTWTGDSATGVNPTVQLPLGTTTVTLTVYDGQYSDTDTVDITVEDNTAPVITCPADVTVEQETGDGTIVPLTATATDLCDADPTITSDELAIYPLGSTVVTFTATDNSGNSASCSMTVTVEDTTPPVITCPADVTVEQETRDGTVVPLIATATDICDADPTITSDELAIYPLGSTVVTFTATDDSGNSAICTTTVTVIDTTPPEIITPSDEQIALWPPNHKYHTVGIADCVISVTDICDAGVGVDDIVITSVSSDEPENVQGVGDGNTVDDIVIVDSQTVKLRAERQGTGNGRVYTINFEVADASGNTATGSCAVWVPHDQGSGSTAIDDGASAGYTVYYP